MYHAHFGLTSPLFAGGIARDQNVFRSSKHEQLIERYKLALASPSSVIALAGQPGIGKTTLTATALRASSPRVAIAWLHGLVTTGTELVELMLAELGLTAERATRVERLQLWRQFHSEMAATDSRVFVIAERADDLPIDVLRALDGLTAPDATGYTGANVVLLGQAGLEQHLESPALESLRQRVRLRARLEPFTEAELQDYLRHQAACAGGDFDRLFAPGAVAALFRHSGGVARVANHLCETSLQVAAGDREKLLTAAVVRRVATTILGLPEAPQPSAAASAASAAPPISTAPPVALATASTTPTPAVQAAPRAPAPITPTPSPPPATAAVSPPAPPSSAPAATAAAPVPSPAMAPIAAQPRDAAPAAVPPRGPEFEFDGEATEVPDVSVVDFPVLTDAVDELPPPKAALPAPVSVAATPPSAAKPAAPEPRRLDTAYAPPRPAAAPKPAPVPTVARARVAPTAPEPPAASPAARPTTTGEDAEDVLRQTQTLRAIADAKSIDDISNSVAETLFGDAELDVLQAALAASMDEADTAPTEAPPPAARPSASRVPARKPVASTGDDLLDLLDLTSDATLELMEEPLDKPAPSRTSAGQR
jgi:general secretion pathway protein A